VSGTGLNKFVLIGTAAFGPRIDSRSFFSAQLVAVADQAEGRGLACTPLDAENSSALGRVAVLDRGECAFTVKVKNAQLAGAGALVVADIVEGTPPPSLPGVDESITIPALCVSQEDGKAIKTASAASAGRPSVGPYAVLFVNPAKLKGADYFDRVYLYTPNPYSGGSSVSHCDTLARPNLLMEPSLNPRQPFDVAAPNDLTMELFRDIGW
jgi:hypothetical protein